MLVGMKTTILTFLAALALALPAFAGSRAYELSTRGNVGTGENVLIGGVIVGDPPTDRPCEDGGMNGQGPISFVVRALGPSLEQYGISGVLADPDLEFYSADGTLLASQASYLDNDPASIAALAATGLTPSDTRECAAVIKLLPGHYTAIVRGADGTTGVALLELYKLSR